MNHPIRLFALAMLALGLAACQGTPSASQENNTPSREIKLYSVPPQQSPALLHALRETVINGHGSTVTQPFPGKLLVAAPAGEQASIGAAIHALSKAAETTPHPEQLHVHFWVIDALPGKGSDSTALQPLSSTLDALRKNIGPSHFLLDDSAMAVATPGETSNKIDTANLHDFVFWIPSSGSDHLQLAIEYNDHSGNDHAGKGFRSLKTVAAMKLDQYVVLAQASEPGGDANTNPSGTDAALRLLVVRVDRADSDR